MKIKKILIIVSAVLSFSSVHATNIDPTMATDAMAEAMRDFYGNPSSLHRMGIDAEKRVRASRKSLAGAFGCSEDEVIFTSCGTEADNTVLMGAAASRKRAGKKISRCPPPMRTAP